ncbi:hypothetical protein [Pseudodesulfovibrio sp.]|uniref:hypothetical protein n=1 Tax=Pseudodesulfovibrio sp. TaxID=2035812 RepID=UPI00261B9B55|nr:hypothetical protein [Pseudodesulfovibrio sp.]MDD3311450.1 hypothetical protein [Pseudodesulfovibrio sp.]
MKIPILAALLTLLLSSPAFAGDKNGLGNICMDCGIYYTFANSMFKEHDVNPYLVGLTEGRGKMLLALGCSLLGKSQVNERTKQILRGFDALNKQGSKKLADHLSGKLRECNEMKIDEILAGTSLQQR